jgi:hypothetical protein
MRLTQPSPGSSRVWIGEKREAEGSSGREGREERRPGRGSEIAHWPSFFRVVRSRDCPLVTAPGPVRTLAFTRVCARQQQRRAATPRRVRGASGAAGRRPSEALNVRSGVGGSGPSRIHRVVCHRMPHCYSESTSPNTFIQPQMISIAIQRAQLSRTVWRGTEGLAHQGQDTEEGWAVAQLISTTIIERSVHPPVETYRSKRTRKHPRPPATHARHIAFHRRRRGDRIMNAAGEQSSRSQPAESHRSLPPIAAIEPTHLREPSTRVSKKRVCATRKRRDREDGVASTCSTPSRPPRHVCKNAPAEPRGWGRGVAPRGGLPVEAGPREREREREQRRAKNGSRSNPTKSGRLHFPTPQLHTCTPASRGPPRRSPLPFSASKPERKAARPNRK